MCRSLLTFWSNLLFESSGSKSKPSKKEAASSYHIPEISTHQLLICFFVGLFYRNEVSTLMYTTGNKNMYKICLESNPCYRTWQTRCLEFFSIREVRGSYLFPDTFSPFLNFLVSFRNFQANDTMTVSTSIQIHHS
jgi:hypothetical protein